MIEILNLDGLLRLDRQEPLNAEFTSKRLHIVSIATLLDLLLGYSVQLESHPVNDPHPVEYDYDLVTEDYQDEEKPQIDQEEGHTNQRLNPTDLLKSLLCIKDVTQVIIGQHHE